MKTSSSDNIYQKGTDISMVTEGKIKKTQHKLNTRPREKLNFCTPKECFFKLID